MCASVLNIIYAEQIHTEIGYHHILLLTFVVFLQPSLALVDCRSACRKCHEQTEQKDILEVYCAMCEECKQRRREKLALRKSSVIETIQTTTKETGIYKDNGHEDIFKHMAQMSEEERKSSIGLTLTKETYSTSNNNDFMHHHDSIHQQDYGHHHEPIQQSLRNHIAYPPGCPTPPPCPESEEYLPMKLTAATTSSTTTTPSTTTQCPQIHTCRKRKRHTQPYPCYPCMPMCPCPMPMMMLSPSTELTTKKDFYHVYVGVPKNAMSG